jgi:hypothetical protein
MLLLLGLAVFQQPAHAQQVVTKIFNKNIDCPPSGTFLVNAEKAMIEITGWNNNYIQAKISFSATHPDKQIAQKELDYMRYAISKDGNVIELHNVFQLPANIDHIQSKLEVSITLMVPSGNKLQVTNKYGNINIRQLSASTRVNIAFGDLHLNDLSGDVHLTTAYSDVRGSHINATSWFCKDEKSKISLDLDGGNYSFFSKYGDLDLTTDKISSLNIKSARTDITIRSQNTDACRYNISSKDGTLFLPEKYAHRLVKKGDRSVFENKGTASISTITVDAIFNSVTIK